MAGRSALPGQGWLVAAMGTAVVGGAVASLAEVPTAVTVAGVAVVVVAGALLFMRALNADRRRRDATVDAVVAGGRWKSYGATRDEPEAPWELRVLPRRKPFGEGLEQLASGWFGATVDGVELWSFEHRETFRAYNSQSREQSTRSEHHHVVLTRLPRRWPLVEVAPARAVDKVRGDVQVGVPAFDDAFRVVSDSEDTARRWLAPVLADELAGDPGAALHGGTLRLHGEVLFWFRAGNMEAEVLDDVARVVSRAARFLPR